MLDEFKNAFQRHNNSHIQLIWINVVIFLVMILIYVPSVIADSTWFFDTLLKYVALPSAFTEFITKPWTIFTYSFVHDYTSIWHILFNMLVLYWFGRIFVEYLGSDKLIAVYVLGALAGGILYLLAYNTIDLYSSKPTIMVGASAAVNAIVVATATLLPDYTLFLLLLGPVRIKYIAMFYVLVSFLGTIGANAGGNIAHLGGALMGFVYIKQLQAGVNWGAWITITLDWFRDLFRSRPKVKVSYRNNQQYQEYKKATSQSRNPAGISQAEIDAILDKISAGGYDSLSKDEKEKLFKASKR